MKKVFTAIILVVAIVGIGAFAVKELKAKKARNASQEVAKIYPIVVSQISPTIKDVKLTLPYLAEVRNDKDVKLSSRISARIKYIKLSGSHVKKGEVIVKLDTVNIKTNLATTKERLQAAKISLKNLKATHERTLELLKIKGASVEQSQKETTLIANAQSQITSLKQKEIELKNNLSYATIKSPVDGVISKTFSNRGALSLPAKPLVAISSKKGFYLMVRVPTQMSLLGVKFHQKEYVATPLRTTYHGLAEYKVYIGDEKLVSGDRVEVDVIIFNQKATLLPFDTILNKNSKSYVFVIDSKKAKPVEVHILQSAKEGLVVEESFENKKLVVAKPDILLRLLSGYMLQVKE